MTDYVPRRPRIRNHQLQHLPALLARRAGVMETTASAYLAGQPVPNACADACANAMQSLGIHDPRAEDGSHAA